MAPSSWELPWCLSWTHNCGGLLSFVCSWSPRIQGSAWYIVGAQEILVMEGIVPSLRFFLLWISISINAHEKALNCLFYIRLNINRNRGFATDINPTTSNIVFYQWHIKHNWLEWVFCSNCLLTNVMETFFFFSSSFFLGHILILFNFFLSWKLSNEMSVPTVYEHKDISMCVLYMCLCLHAVIPFMYQPLYVHIQLHFRSKYAHHSM